MENNEENLGSQEPTTQTTSTTKKSFNAKPIIIIVAVVAILLVLFFVFFTRSAKATVKDYLKALDKGNEKKVISLIDYEGANALSACAGYSNGKYQYDFSKFNDKYDDQMDKIKDMDKDEKEEYKDEKQENLEKFASRNVYSDDEYKIKIKEIKTSKVKDAKNVTKVKVKVQIEDEDGEKETETLTYYTMKKGFKNYIISPSGAMDTDD